jgi:hypothetical protein
MTKLFYTNEQDIKNDEISKKFKKRYILAIGWPLPHYKEKKGILIGMQNEMGKEVHIVFPLDVRFDDNDCPQYRLVLERI